MSPILLTPNTNTHNTQKKTDNPKKDTKRDFYDVIVYSKSDVES